MSDIVPDLYKKILRDFRSAVALDPWIKSFNKRLDAGKATQEDVQKYAGRIGKYGENALIRGLKKENLPGGIIYWNIAKRTVEPLMKIMAQMVNEAYTAELSNRYQKMHIGIKPVTVEFNQERCDAIMNKLVSVFMEAATEGMNEQ
ncbi:MAG: hypothetical protein ACOYJI_02655 [Anaerovoracaceae bacterium]|jgi:hypothetical protein